MRFREALRRRGLWAVGATLVVPGVLAVAIATTMLGGGFRQLGAVAQVVTGPGIPEAHLNAGTLAGERSRSRLPTVPRLRPELSGGVAAAAAPRSAAGPVDGDGDGDAVAEAPTRRPGPGSPVQTPGGAVAGAPPAGLAPPPSSSPIRQAGEQVADTAGGLPAPAGQAGHDTVMTVVDLIEPALRQAPALPLPADR